MKTRLLMATIALALTGLAHAEGMNMPMSPAQGTAASAPAGVLVDGEVRKIDLQRGLIVLRHNDIPNLDMPGMTMGFKIADPKLLEGLKVGSKVRFHAEMLKGEATVTAIKLVR